MKSRNLDPVGPLAQADENSQLFQILTRANQIADETELSELLDEMLNLIIQISGASTGMLYLLDENNRDNLVFKAAAGDEDFRPVLGGCKDSQLRIAQDVVQKREPEIIENLESDSRWCSPAESKETALKKVISFPLLLRGKPTGVVQVFNYTHSPLVLMQFLGNRMASEIEKSFLLNTSQHRGERFEAMVDIIGEFISTLDPHQVLNRIVEHAKMLLNAEAVSIFLVDEQSGEAVLHLATNVSQDQSIRVPPGEGLIGHVIQSGETVVISNTDLDKRHYKGVDLDLGHTTNSLIAAPLHASEIVLGSERGVAHAKIIGGIEAINKADGMFNDGDAEILGILANQAATILHIAQIYTNADELFLSTIRALVAAIDLKDPYTEGHSQRVSEFSAAMAEELGLSLEEIRHIRIGALLHDIGKIGIPDHILGKPGSLTDEEFNEIKKHPALGAKIISEVKSLRSELAALAEHHERLDGQGYPNGLKGDQISLIGRVVAVADVFDALTSDRPYRKAMDIDNALETLQNETDHHLDSQIIESMLRAYKRGKIRPQNSETTSS
ncbi:MAG: HD domain-containing phosphohydrolase [Chloroflexota bacterium]